MTQADFKRHIKSVLKGVLSFSAPLFSRKSTLDSAAARTMLLDCAPRPTGTARANHPVVEPACDLQIIVPAYNVEQYLEACMESILSQETEYSFRVVLIDDGSKDNTPAIADRYADHPLVTVIHQKNSGPAAARNHGLSELFGRYIMFVDSDDALCQGAIQSMLTAAYRHDSDIVEGGMYYRYPDHEAPAYRHPSSRKLTNPYSLQGYPCGKLFKAALFEKTAFPEGFWYEDSIVSFLLLPAASNIYIISDMVYSYRVNPSGMTHSTHGKPKSIDTYWITEELVQEHFSRNLPAGEAYFRFLLHQIRLNQHRIFDLDSSIQEGVFILTCDLYSRYFPVDFSVKEYKTLIKALRARDFGMFRICCRLL